MNDKGQSNEKAVSLSIADDRLTLQGKLLIDTLVEITNEAKRVVSRF